MDYLIELWNELPDYLIFWIPVALFIVIGIRRKRKGKSHIQLYIGLILMTIPIFHIASDVIKLKGYDNNIIGDYTTTTDTLTVLRIYDNGEFVSQGHANVLPKGKGKWKIKEWDIIELDLYFDSKENELFEVYFYSSRTEIHYDPWKNIDFKLVKKVKNN